MLWLADEDASRSRFLKKIPIRNELKEQRGKAIDFYSKPHGKIPLHVSTVAG
jgi:hypothetical protein